MVQGRIVVSRFDSEHDVVTLANATPYGLAAYFHIQDVARVWRVADAPQSGIVGINEGALAAEAAPYTGHIPRGA
jgi:succinate-semialdehyde dehydrogenase/glutarate-semialdehyde dehydrogenase